MSVIEKPMLFSGEMVRALLDGRKTQTRRAVKFHDVHADYGTPNLDKCWVDSSYAVTPCLKVVYGKAKCLLGETTHRHFPAFEVGNQIWCKETFGLSINDRSIIYRADDENLSPSRNLIRGVWKPSIFMPKAASRITLEVTRVRVERLNEISDADAIAEGIEDHQAVTARSQYAVLWESINGPRSWALNPHVWCYSFRRIKP